MSKESSSIRVVIYVYEKSYVCAYMSKYIWLTQIIKANAMCGVVFIDRTSRLNYQHDPPNDYAATAAPRGGCARRDDVCEVEGVCDNQHGWLAPFHGQCIHTCLLYTSPSPRDVEESRMPSSA